MLILASASRARSKLLDQVGIDYRVLVSGIDETRYSYSNVVDMVGNLAEKKAQSIVDKLLSRQCNEDFSNAKAVLGCDSLFEFEGEIFGKSKDSRELIDRWRKMSSSSGILHTGHCLFVKSNSTGKDRIGWGNYLFKDVVSTKISFLSLTNKEIINYVNSGEPLQCAGGFAIEGKGGFFISNIHGCYSNVIGLSMHWLKKTLEKSCLLDELIKLLST